MLGLQLLDLNTQIEEGITDCFDLVDKWDNTINTTNKYLSFKKMCEQYGLSKSAVEYFKSDADIEKMIAALDLDLSLDKVDYDYFFKVTDKTQNVVASLEEHITEPHVLSKQKQESIQNSFKETHNNMKAFTDKAFAYLKDAKKELSNSSKRGIPAKMNSCKIRTYPLDENGNMKLSEPTQALTLGEIGYTHETVVSAIDNAMAVASSVAKEKVFLSENRQELLETLNKYRTFSRDVRQYLMNIMTLYKGYKSCC